jgi:tRNA (guanine37-N1)-methyltransferase
MFEGFLSESILKRAIQAGHLSVELVNFRDYAIDKHKVVDAIPYGGGAGMLLKPEPLIAAIEAVKQRLEGGTLVVLLSPQGETFVHEMAQGYIKWDNLIFICGHYEGFDERIRNWVDQEVSLGDFIVRRVFMKGY